MPEAPVAVAVEVIASRILVLRGQRVMIDADLAALYGVATKRLNEQVKRNAQRFPPDFLFPLTPAEKAEVVANCDHLANLKFAKTMPFAFTEHGALMAASVLNTDRAVEVSVYVVRAFVQLRELLAGNKELARRLDQLEQRLERKLVTHDQAIAGILDALRQLMAPPPASKRAIGFVVPEERKKP
jgi:hypothetical protein